MLSGASIGDIWPIIRAEYLWVLNYNNDDKSL